MLSSKFLITLLIKLSANTRMSTNTAPSSVPFPVSICTPRPLSFICTDIWNGLRMKAKCLNEPPLDTQSNASAEDTKLIDSFYCGSLTELTSGLTTLPVLKISRKAPYCDAHLLCCCDIHSVSTSMENPGHAEFCTPMRGPCNLNEI